MIKIALKLEKAIKLYCTCNNFHYLNLSEAHDVTLPSVVIKFNQLLEVLENQIQKLNEKTKIKYCDIMVEKALKEKVIGSTV